jgi:hypothetical protein
MDIPQEQATTATQTDSAVTMAVAKYKVPEAQAIALRSFFDPLEKQINEWKEKAFQIEVTDISQTKLIKDAKSARLMVRDIRLNIDKLHKEKKEDSLREGQLLDLIKRTLTGWLEPIEGHLKKQEDFIKLQEQKQVDDLKTERLAALAAYRFEGDNIDALQLGEMVDTVFETFLAGIKSGHDQRVANAAEAERVKKEKEESDRIERDKIQKENEALALLKERTEVLARLGFTPNVNGNWEHHGIQYGLSIDQLKKMPDRDWFEISDFVNVAAKKYTDEQQRIKDDADAKAKEARDKQEKDELDRKAEELKKRKEARAPDKTKLLALAEKIKLIEQPELKTQDGKDVLLNVQVLLGKVYKYINDQCANL